MVRDVLEFDPCIFTKYQEPSWSRVLPWFLYQVSRTLMVRYVLEFDPGIFTKYQEPSWLGMC